MEYYYAFLIVTPHVKIKKSLFSRSFCARHISLPFFVNKTRLCKIFYHFFALTRASARAHPRALARSFIIFARNRAITKRSGRDWNFASYLALSRAVTHPKKTDSEMLTVFYFHLSLQRGQRVVFLLNIASAEKKRTARLSVFCFYLSLQRGRRAVQRRDEFTPKNLGFFRDPYTKKPRRRVLLVETTGLFIWKML